MNIIEAFKIVRDIPYRIPLSLTEEDECCTGKHRKLKGLLTEYGFTVRYRVCSFLWSSLHLPSKVLNIRHDDLSSHVWLEVLIGNKWITVDATWDINLNNIFPVNKWDGKSNTEIAVKPLELFTPEKSNFIMDTETSAGIVSDLKKNGAFYSAFNNWLSECRERDKI